VSASPARSPPASSHFFYLSELLPIPFQHLQKTVFFPIACLRKRDANYAILVFLSIVAVNVQT
jgi:hypothetical protein